MTQHTPGPWKVSGSLITTNLRPLALVLSTYTPPKKGRTPRDYDAFAPEANTADANARLIAAAPELLEALQGLLTNAPAPKGISNDYSYILYREAAKTAIAKATGGNQ
jgi:hypothetical protein